MERRKRTSEIPKSMVELAERYGYEPGDFLIRRFVENRRIVEGWLEDIEHDRIPADLSTTNMGVARKIVRESLMALMEQEHDLLPYFHGKKKHIEFEPSNLGLADLLRGMNEKNAGGSGDSE